MKVPNSSNRICLFLAVAVLSSVTVPAYAISIDGFSTAYNDRFANDSSFIMSSFDLSGVARAEDGKWVTMVSENVFLTAKHFSPTSGTLMMFYANNDPDGPYETRSVQKIEHISGSDIGIGTLNSPLSSNSAYYDFATDDTNNNNTGGGGPFGANSESFINSPYYNTNAYVMGVSPSIFSTSQDIAVGLNKLDQWFDSVDVSGTIDDAIGSTVDSSGDPNYLTYEARMQDGDSGAPMFVEDGNGGLTLVGLNWFIGTSGTDDVNGQSYLGNYDEEIQLYIDANAVPEPSTLLLCLVGLMTVALARRR
jgi:V8-like Glu-specific endopeptidase